MPENHLGRDAGNGILLSGTRVDQGLLSGFGIVCPVGKMMVFM